MKLLILLAISSTASAWYGYYNRAPGEGGDGGLRAIVENSENDMDLLATIRTVALRHPAPFRVKNQLPRAEGEELLSLLEGIYSKPVTVQETSIQEFLNQLDADGKDGPLVFVGEITRQFVGEENFDKLLANELWLKMLKTIIDYEEDGTPLRNQGKKALARNPKIFFNLIEASRSLFL